eukprot:715942-Rhodomonas_salina.1
MAEQGTKRVSSSTKRVRLWHHKARGCTFGRTRTRAFALSTPTSLPTRSVLPYRKLLRAPYAVSGTTIAYAATAL